MPYFAVKTDREMTDFLKITQQVTEPRLWPIEGAL